MCVPPEERRGFASVYNTVGFKEAEVKVFLSSPITAKILEVERFTSAQDRFNITSQRSVNKVHTHIPQQSTTTHTNTHTLTQPYLLYFSCLCRVCLRYLRLKWDMESSAGWSRERRNTSWTSMENWSDTRCSWGCRYPPAGKHTDTHTHIKLLSDQILNDILRILIIEMLGFFMVQ